MYNRIEVEEKKSLRGLSITHTPNVYLFVQYYTKHNFYIDAIDVIEFLYAILRV